MKVLLALMLLLTSLPAHAALRLPALFSDDMVLQEGQPCPVWGWATAGEEVTVQILGQISKATAGPDGKWQARLAPLAATGPQTMTVATPTETRTIRNILIGEVWICSGQSNMEMPMQPQAWGLGVLDHEQEIAHADLPNLRLFKVPNMGADALQTDVKATWQPCTPASVADFSAVAYYYGRELHRQLKKPVGVIQCAAGGSAVQQWTPIAALEALPDYKAYLERFTSGKEAYRQQFAAYQQALDQWAAAGGPQAGPAPSAPVQDLTCSFPNVLEQSHRRLYQYWLDRKHALESVPAQPVPALPLQEAVNPAPSQLYNAMLHPLIPFAIKGAIWYQGESNTSGDEGGFWSPRQYGQLFPALIKSWRQLWGQGDFAFYFCQLPNFAGRAKPDVVKDPANPQELSDAPPSDAWPENAWPEMREVQAAALSLPNTGMAVLIDIGDAFDIHPRNKAEVGRRLAQLALNKTYGEKVAASGPAFTGKLKIKRGQATLKFNTGGGDLVAQGGTLRGFTIAGEDQRFHAATATLKGRTVTVSSPQVPEPVAIRYAWGANPRVTLANSAGLLAAPFRTDAWPIPETLQIDPKTAQWQPGLQLPALISDNMVLASGQPCPIWGWAAPGEKVTVLIHDQQAEAHAGADGRWQATLQPLTADAPLTMTVATATQSKLIQNILVGDVWLCSGQSNMAVNLEHPLMAHYAAEIAQANDPQLRLFMVEENVEASSPRLDVKGQWKLCTPESAGAFSAAGYFFGRDLRAARKQPVGLICNAASGSPAEAWIDRSAMAADPQLAPYLEAWEKQWPAYVPVRAEFNAKIAAWTAAKTQAAAAGQPEPPAPPPPPIMASIRTIPWIPGCFHNGILAPLMPYGLHGVAWYQGESNTFRSAHYGETLRLMIRNWRAGFGQPELPFLIVQLPAWEPDSANGGPFNWAQVREGQLQALAEPHTALITTLDLNDDHDLHPRNKLDVGRRLALAARGVAYGESLEYAGPLVESVNVRGARVQVRFTHAEGGLVAKPGPHLVGFELAGADGRYYPAQAVVKGDTVVLTAPEVPKPATVRYAFANQPAFSLYNAAGLPASPFRTDTRLEAPDVQAGEE